MKNSKNLLNPMNKTLLVCLMLVLVLPSMRAQESIWKIDPNHSKINFGISYFKVGEINGIFETYTGSFTQDGDAISTTEITIKTSSITTHQADRDKHLRSNDFFGAQQYPEIKFVSNEIINKGNGEYEIKGEFTMTGITKPIVLKAVDKGVYVHPRFKTTNKFIKVTGVINREDFKVGTNYPPAKFALGKEVDLVAEIHLTKKK